MTKKIKPRKSNSSWAIKILIFSLVLLFLGVLSIAAYKKGYTDGEKIASLKHEKDQEKLLAKITKIASPSQEKVKRSDLPARNDLVGKLQDVLKAEQESRLLILSMNLILILLVILLKALQELLKRSLFIPSSKNQN